MAIFLVTFGVMLVAVAAMAIGVIFGRQAIKGSCGGLNNPELGGQCEACSCQQVGNKSGVTIKV